MTARDSALATLAGRLTARDRWLLRMLYEHTVLTTTHLHRLGWAATLRQVQGRARALRTYEVLDGFRPLRPYGHGSHPGHLVLGPIGAQVLAAETGMTVADLGYRGRTRALTVAHRLSLGHDVGVTDLVCDLATTPTVTLVRWWSARRCGRYFGHHGARPDAYLTLTTYPRAGARAGGAAGWWEMFVEYDTGSENLHQLTSKVAGYHALAEDTGVVTPVGVWFTRPGREPSARRALAEAVQALPTPGRVPILTAAPQPFDSARLGEPTGTARMTAGERVWLPLRPGMVERVDLATIAISRPRSPVGLGADPGTGPGLTADADDRGGVLPAPHPAPPRTAQPGEKFRNGVS